MRQPFVLTVALLWVGATLVLGSLRWFDRRSLHDRLRPYVDGVAAPDPEDSTRNTFARVLGPVASDALAAAARLAGVDEDLTRRLERVHDELDPMSFRLRQLVWMLAGEAIALAVVVMMTPPPPLALLLLAGAPLLAFLVIEARLSHRSDEWKRSLRLELPVVSEQIGMLLSAGYSMHAAIARIASRSSGCVTRDLRRVVARVGHGVDELQALREWAETADVPAVHRLVSVLALDREAGDLGHIITEEARAVRLELHRDLVEVIEKRTQQVWIPVTVATLVPGLLFLAVPFSDALRLFSSA